MQSVPPHAVRLAVAAAMVAMAMAVSGVQSDPHRPSERVVVVTVNGGAEEVVLHEVHVARSRHQPKGVRRGQDIGWITV